MQESIQVMNRHLKAYIDRWPYRAGTWALEFVDQNFRRQGYLNQTLIPWRRTKDGKKKNRFARGSDGILIASGRLRRETRISTETGAFTLINNTPYASVHNEGYNGMVSIPAHERRKLEKQKLYNIKSRRGTTTKIDTGVRSEVKAHTRHMNIPRRQYMPSDAASARGLMRIIGGRTEKDFTKILEVGAGKRQEIHLEL